MTGKPDAETRRRAGGYRSESAVVLRSLRSGSAMGFPIGQLS